MKEKNLAAVLLGQASRKKRHKGKNAAEISQMYRDLRAKRVIPKPTVA